MYTDELEDQAMSSLFHLVCSLYKVGLSLLHKSNHSRKATYFRVCVCVCGFAKYMCVLCFSGRQASSLYWSPA